MTNPSDIPFDEACDRANDLVLQGVDVYQKWTCAKCGDRVTGNNANKFYTLGLHEDCGYTTDLRESGCGYMAIYSTKIRRPPHAE